MIVLSSSKDVLSRNFRITKTKEVTGVNSPQIYFKAVVRRGLRQQKYDVIGGGKFKYMKEISKTY